MARKIKFALELKDGYQARSNIDEIKNYFDTEKIISYFYDGRLLKWLQDRHCQEAAQVEALDKNDVKLAAKLCEIFGVQDESAHTISGEESLVIAERESKRQRLMQYTTDEAILALAENAAFDEEDLAKLIEKGVKDILLCGGRISIPLTVKNIHYRGIGKAVAVIDSKVEVDFSLLGIEFTDLPFDEEYEINKKSPPIYAYDLGVKFQDEGDKVQAKEYFQKSAELGNPKGMYQLAQCYENGYGTKKNVKSAIEWYQQAAAAGDADAMDALGRSSMRRGKKREAAEWYLKSAQNGSESGMMHIAACYEIGDGVSVSPVRAREWYEKAAEAGNADASSWLKILNNNVGERLAKAGDKVAAFELYKKSAEAGYGLGMYNLATCYQNGQGVSRDYELAYEWYGKAVEAGVKKAAKKQKRVFATTPDALAELLSVLVYGKLKNGQELWHGSGWVNHIELCYTPLCKRSHWARHDGETVIGFAEEVNLFSANEFIIFTDDGIYLQDDYWYYRDYDNITNVYDYPDNGFQIISGDDVFYLRNAKFWDKMIGRASIRLFLLVAAKLKGDCDYQFTDEETSRLKQVRLEALDNRCILDCL